MRNLLRALTLAVYLALAPSEHDELWAHLDSRPVVVLVVGAPTLPLVAIRRARYVLGVQT